MNHEILKTQFIKLTRLMEVVLDFIWRHIMFFVTNYHVIEGNKFVSIENQTQDRYKAQVVYVSPQTDIAFYEQNILYRLRVFLLVRCKPYMPEILFLF